MKMAFKILLAATAILAASSVRAADLSPFNKQMESVWKNVDDMTGKLSLFFNYSERVAESFKDIDKDNEGAHWYYIQFDYNFMKPNTNYYVMNVARNLGKDYVSKTIEDNPGTILAAGWNPKTNEPLDNDTNLYVKLNPANPDDPGLAALAASIYVVQVDINKSWIGEVTFADNIKALFDRMFSRFEKDRTKIEDSDKFAVKHNFIVTKEGEVKYKTIPWKGKTSKITYTPANPAKNHFIDKEIVFFDKDTKLPLQYEAWEGDTLAACFSAWEIKINPGVKESMWTEMFENSKGFNQITGSPK